MSEWIESVVQVLFLVWLLGVAPACTGIVIGWGLSEAIWQWMQWRESRKAKSTDTPGSPGNPGNP